MKNFIRKMGGPGPIGTMGVTSLIAIGAIAYSHDSQIRDKELMRAGVERDKERLKQKRKEEKRLRKLQQQQQQQG